MAFDESCAIYRKAVDAGATKNLLTGRPVKTVFARKSDPVVDILKVVQASLDQQCENSCLKHQRFAQLNREASHMREPR
jgi:hypothetical protein